MTGRRRLWLLVGLTMGMRAPARAADQVPFKGVFYPQIVQQVPLSPGVFRLDIIVPGQATHLGSFTGTATAILDMTCPTSPNAWCYTGSYCWTSPNGKDMVCGDFSGSFVATTDPCLRTNVETSTVTGGTGRFANATGNQVAGGFLDLCTGQNVVPFAGTISRPFSR